MAPVTGPGTSQPAGLSVSWRTEGCCAVAALSGELDIACAAALREQLLGLLRLGSGRLVIDLSGVSYCDASGLSVLVVTGRRAELLGGLLMLAAPPPAIASTLRAMGLHRRFGIFATVQAATADTRPGKDRRPAKAAAGRPGRDRLATEAAAARPGRDRPATEAAASPRPGRDRPDTEAAARPGRDRPATQPASGAATARGPQIVVSRNRAGRAVGAGELRAAVAALLSHADAWHDADPDRRFASALHALSGAYARADNAMLAEAARALSTVLTEHALAYTPSVAATASRLRRILDAG
jgi:anti-sigma B factor antagonist